MCSASLRQWRSGLRPLWWRVKLGQTIGETNSPIAHNLNDWRWLPIPDHDSDHDIDGYQIPEGAGDEAGLE